MTRKITRAVAHIQAGLQDHLYLGNLEARLDWGYAAEYVEAMRHVRVDADVALLEDELAGRTVRIDRP